jgi:hypothetical protein
VSKLGLKWLPLIALITVLASCNQSTSSQQTAASFDNQLIGSWSDVEHFTTSDGRPVEMRLHVTFAADHTFRLTLHDQAVDPVAFEGTWDLRNDADLKYPGTSRILVLTAIEPIGGDHLVVFAGQELISQLMPRMSGEMRRWQRVQ